MNLKIVGTVEMPKLRLKYMVDDYWDLIGEKDWELPSLKLEYLIPDYKELKKRKPNQLSFKLKRDNSTAA
ncbi:MAG: hypothetical protein PVH63_02885 [Balneolaceae bacterium]|jgi:hypothetical protein